MSDHDQPQGDAPQYKLTEAAYIDDTLYAPGDAVRYVGIPGYHMEPLNQAAHAMKKKHPSKFEDPILAMTNVTARA